MHKQRHTPKQQCKDNDFIALKQAARLQWAKGPQTMKQVTRATGIVREHLCRFTKEWRNEGTMYVHHIGVCPVTGVDGVMFLALCSPNSVAGLQRFINTPPQGDLFAREGLKYEK